jgi:ankyrin repeat protein
MMKALMIQFLLSCLLLSCSKIGRDKPVEETDLIGDDYRLFQNTPAWELAKAVQMENERKIKEIVSKDSSIINFQESKYGNTLLILTVSNQQMKSFKILLEQRADVNIHNFYEGTSALIEACSFKQYAIEYAEILLKYGANVNDIQVDKYELHKVKSALMKSAKTGNKELVSLLVQNGFVYCRCYY